MLIATSPGPRSRPSAAPALSPHPAATMVPEEVSPATSVGAEDTWQPRHPAEGLDEDVVAVALLGHRVVARPGGVAAVGDGLVGATGQAPGQPVVGEQHAVDALGDVGSLLRQPGQLGHRERRHGYDAHVARPGLRTPVGLEPASLVGRTDVVPQQCVEDRFAVVAQGDHAVLLGADGDGQSSVVEPRLGLQGAPPVVRVDRGAVGMTGARRGEDLARVGVDAEHLRALGRRVDADHGARQGARHGATLVGSWQTPGAPSQVVRGRRISKVGGRPGRRGWYSTSPPWARVISRTR